MAYTGRNPIEFVQTKFIRWLLGVNKFCSSNACRSEVGRFPTRTKTKRKAIKFWLKFWEPEHLILWNSIRGSNWPRQKGTLAKQIKTAIKCLRSWQHMVSENEHSRKHELPTTETLWHRTTKLAKYTMMNERTWIEKNKLRNFRKFKLTHDYGNYLTRERNIKHWVAITKQRLSNHQLHIKTGR